MSKKRKASKIGSPVTHFPGVEEQFNHAITLHQRGELTAAKRLYEDILNLQPMHADTLHLLGIIALQSNNNALAVELIEKAISVSPTNPIFYSNRGVALKALKQYPIAVASYDQAIAIKPDYVEAHYNRGNALAEMQQLEAAIASYDQAITIKPDYASAYCHRGNALYGLNQLQAAIYSYDKAISVKPDYAEAHCNRGSALYGLNQLAAAISSYDRAIAVKPDYAEAYSNRGSVLSKLKNMAEAIANYDKAIAINPRYAEAYFNKGCALHELGQLEAAVASYDQAITIKPDYADAYCNRGSVLHGLNQPQAAIADYDRAIAIQPNHVNAHCNRGNALGELKQITEAISSYDRAIAIQPDYAKALLNKSLTLLLNGDFENGWKLHEWRWKTEENQASFRQFAQPFWLGAQSLEGKKILLHSEQGFGDTIQFCRYAQLVAKLGGSVILEVPADLVDVLHNLAGVSQLIATGDQLPSFDYHCPLLSLPLAFKNTLNNVPSAPFYLQANPQRKMRWADRLGVKTQPRIGLVWRGRSYKNVYNRNLTLPELLQYLPDECQYVCLQKELSDIEQSALLTANKQIHFFNQELRDFSDTAALCDLMDLVISVDTSVAHLAGALGKETWILLPFVPDWRWLLDRDDSIWYPSVRLYRQSAYDDWEGTLKKLHTDMFTRIA